MRKKTLAKSRRHRTLRMEVLEPREIMLRWYDGDWNQGAYWGANLINVGTDGTASRRFMGLLPRVAQWVRLAVPASQVDMEWKTAVGMRFALYDGRVTFDTSGTGTSPNGLDYSYSWDASGISVGSTRPSATRQGLRPGFIAANCPTWHRTASACHHPRLPKTSRPAHRSERCSPPTPILGRRSPTRWSTMPAEWIRSSRLTATAQPSLVVG